VILGFLKNKRDLRDLKQHLVRSNTRGVYKCDNDDRLIAQNLEIRQIAWEIERRRIQLGKPSGYERLYARVTKLYFGGMARHLSELWKVLKPGARLFRTRFATATGEWLREEVRILRITPEAQNSSPRRRLGAQANLTIRTGCQRSG
jgi:hypothetical protein